MMVKASDAVASVQPKGGGGMPEELLLELKAAAPLTAELEGLEKQGPALEQLWDVYVHQVGSAMKRLQGSAQVFEHIWKEVILAVAGGETTKIHALRPQFISYFERGLSALKRIHVLAGKLRRSNNKEDVPDPDVLVPEIAHMERLKSNVFDRWHTAEDLEDLAARDYPLNTADLDQIGPQRRPAGSYYAEESKPF
jgi:hypothetical protein